MKLHFLIGEIDCIQNLSGIVMMNLLCSLVFLSDFQPFLHSYRGFLELFFSNSLCTPYIYYRNQIVLFRFLKLYKQVSPIFY